MAHKESLASIREHIYSDFVNNDIKNYYKKYGISYDFSSKNNEDCIADFFNFLYKRIPIQPREVKVSAELKSKIDKLPSIYNARLESFVDWFENGKNMNHFMSKKAGKPDFLDYLRNVCNIYHLHLSDYNWSREGIYDEKYYSERSDYHLLCLVNNEKVFFIDVLPHMENRDFFNPEHLRIIKDNNWLEEMGAVAVNETCEVLNIECEDLYTLYKMGNFNIPLKICDKFYTLKKGITATGHPLEVVDAICRINRKINEYCNDIQRLYLENKDGRYYLKIKVSNMDITLFDFSGII